MGEKLRLLRLRCQMTQDQVAERLKCDKEKISRYENGWIQHPDYFFICSLADLFGVSCDYFR